MKKNQSQVLLSLSLLLLIPYLSGCCTAAGALLGGGAGSVIGGGVGLCRGAPGEGVQRGAAVGMVVGAATGAVADVVILSPVALVSSAFSDGTHQVTAREIAKMHDSGVDDLTIIRQIESTGMSRPLTADEIVDLSTKGVNGLVIQAAQEHPEPISAMDKMELASKSGSPQIPEKPDPDAFPESVGPASALAERALPEGDSFSPAIPRQAERPLPEPDSYQLRR